MVAHPTHMIVHGTAAQATHSRASNKRQIQHPSQPTSIRSSALAHTKTLRFIHRSTGLTSCRCALGVGKKSETGSSVSRFSEMLASISKFDMVGSTMIPLWVVKEPLRQSWCEIKYKEPRGWHT
eukprot:247370-Rhodomonas_salina.1